MGIELLGQLKRHLVIWFEKWLFTLHDDDHAYASSSTIGNLQGLFSIIVVNIVYY